MNVVEVVGLLRSTGPAYLEVFEVLSIVEERIEPFPGSGGIRSLVDEAGHCVDVICQPGRPRKPQCAIAGNVEGADPDAKGVVEEVRPGADQRKDIDLPALIDVARDVARFFGRDMPGTVYRAGAIPEAGMAPPPKG